VSEVGEDIEEFGGIIGDTYQDSVAWWPSESLSVGRPNVVFIVIDDMGFGKG